MPRVDHAAEAMRIHGQANAFEIAHATSDTAVDAFVICAAVANGYAAAQVHATLALVEQQRIANLIAVGEESSREEYEERIEPLRPEIREALGL